MTPRLGIVVPCFNEARRLDVPAFAAFVGAETAVTLCLVDDGSTDGTAARLEAVRAEAPDRVQVVVLERNVGKAEAVRRGLVHLLEAGCQRVGYLDADLAAPLDAMLLLDRVLDAHPGVALVLGARVKLMGWRIRRSERRHYLGRVFATFASLALGLPVYDTQCGAKLLRADAGMRELLDRPFLSRWLFDVELIARVRDRYGAAAIREMPLPQWEDPGGSSVRFRDFLRAPWELWRIRRRYGGGR